ncbi:MAG: FAD:protein FMN transferase [Solirubrobacterales bacterium]|nr:FAD:protein FMN transferase [Solirubrobacterales bacterium]
MSGRSIQRTFSSLGGKVNLQGGGDGALEAVAAAEKAIRDLHRRLTRFEDDSELSRLNSDPRHQVPSSPVMIRFAQAARYAGELSGGLVDATLLEAIKKAGYTESIDPDSAEPAAIDFTGPAKTNRSPGAASASSRWESISVDHITNSVSRPPGVKLDSGGIGKGLAADIGAELLDHLDYFAVGCSGDLRFGNKANSQRQILVASPWRGEEPVGELRLAGGAVCTSGITRRSWVNDEGRPSHHLIDPRSGEPAFTGVTQVTAVAPTAVEGEARAKAALLAGPEEAPEWLIHGGVIVLDDRQVITVGEPAAMVAS